VENVPKSGIWQQTRKTKSVIAVQSIFSRNWIFLSGFDTSGTKPQKGFTNSRNLTGQKFMGLKLKAKKT
jgi:hypothetical protein